VKIFKLSKTIETTM